MFNARNGLILWFVSAIIGISIISTKFINRSVSEDVVVPLTPSRANEATLKKKTTTLAGGVLMQMRDGPQSVEEKEKAALATALADDEIRNTDEIKVYTLRKSMERTVLIKYKYIFDYIALNPEARKRLKQLFFEREMQIYDLSAATASQGIAVGSPAYSSAFEAMQREFRSRVGEIAGSEKDRVYELVDVAPQMLHIDMVLAPQFAYLGSPLSSDQKMRLALTMKEIDFTPGRPAFGNQLDQAPDLITGLLPIYSDLINKSEAFLSPAQVEIFKPAQNYMRAMRNTGKK